MRTWAYTLKHKSFTITYLWARLGSTIEQFILYPLVLLAQHQRCRILYINTGFSNTARARNITHTDSGGLFDGWGDGKLFFQTSAHREVFSLNHQNKSQLCKLDDKLRANPSWSWELSHCKTFFGLFFTRSPLNFKMEIRYSSWSTLKWILTLVEKYFLSLSKQGKIAIIFYHCCLKYSFFNFDKSC